MLSDRDRRLDAAKWRRRLCGGLARVANGTFLIGECRRKSMSRMVNAAYGRARGGPFAALVSGVTGLRRFRWRVRLQMRSPWPLRRPYDRSPPFPRRIGGSTRASGLDMITHRPQHESLHAELGRPSPDDWRRTIAPRCAWVRPWSQRQQEKFELPGSRSFGLRGPDDDRNRAVHDRPHHGRHALRVSPHRPTKDWPFISESQAR